MRNLMLYLALCIVSAIGCGSECPEGYRQAVVRDPSATNPNGIKLECRKAIGDGEMWAE